MGQFIFLSSASDSDLWKQIVDALLRNSPYVFFLLLGFLAAYLFFKFSIKEIREISDKADERISRAYSEAFNKMDKLDEIYKKIMNLNL